MENRINGKVLWFSDRDENGIIVDSNGNEFYFDRSVLLLDLGEQVKRKMGVIFELNAKISSCKCAKNVRIDKE
jgi:hypothetical protein